MSVRIREWAALAVVGTTIIYVATHPPRNGTASALSMGALPSATPSDALNFGKDAVLEKGAFVALDRDALMQAQRLLEEKDLQAVTELTKDGRVGVATVTSLVIPEEVGPYVPFQPLTTWVRVRGHPEKVLVFSRELHGDVAGYFIAHPDAAEAKGTATPAAPKAKKR